jgi:hypothetical protein
MDRTKAEAKESEVNNPMGKDRVGAVATDPLRVLGLKAIFSEAMQLEIVHLSVPGALDDVSSPWC